MKKTISIYGGGWLGAPLAFKLALTDTDVRVSASSVHPQAAHPKISVIEFRAEPEMPAENWSSMNDAEVQIWAIPPRRKKNSEETYLAILQEWVDNLSASSAKKLIFLSSTSVYSNVSDTVDENSGINEDSLMAKAEAIVSSSKTPSVILRLAGLMGGDRYVGKYFSGKRNDGANCPINYVHKDDVVALIALAAERIDSGIYNIVAPIHPTKGDVGENDIERRGLPVGYWDYSVTCLGGKVVSGDKICQELNYEFRWPDPLQFPI
jgi:nucleoside-diphosphate-sugar epimerase